MFPVLGYRFSEDELKFYLRMHGLGQHSTSGCPADVGSGVPCSDSDASSSLQTLGSASSGGGIPGHRSEDVLDSDPEEVATTPAE